MPTYDYLCTGCGQAFEVFQRMSDEPLSSCPRCGAPARRRITGGAGFIFKGDGFYITDHRSKDYKDRAAADAGREKPASAPKAGPGGGGGSGDGGGGSAGGHKEKAAAPAAGSGRTSSRTGSGRKSGSASPKSPAASGSSKGKRGGGPNR